MTAATPTKPDQTPITHPRAFLELADDPTSGRFMETLPPICTDHQGAHVRYLGSCQALRAPHESRRRYCRPRRAPELDAQRVELVNQDDLGVLIAESVLVALRLDRADRDARPTDQAPPRTHETPAEPKAVPTVTVWTPDDSGG